MEVILKLCYDRCSDVIDCVLVLENCLRRVLRGLSETQIVS